jgi:enamine deaminase RidA (YjgF/YER057c/UK114 family)
MPIEVIVPEENRKSYETMHFAPAVHHDGLVFCSGSVGSPEGSAEEEFRQAWKQIGKTLEAAGCGYDDIIDSTIYLVDMQKNARAMFTVKDEFIEEPYPASTWIGTTELVIPGARAEIKVIARKK